MFVIQFECVGNKII